MQALCRSTQLYATPLLPLYDCTTARDGLETPRIFRTLDKGDCQLNHKKRTRKIATDEWIETG